jgi:hypothetical protein
MEQAAHGELVQVITGWLLTWCNCPERGLPGGRRAEVQAARRAASEGAGVLAAASKEELVAALDRALSSFPALCPDVPEERRLRIVAHLARVLEGGRLPDSLSAGSPKIG